MRHVETRSGHEVYLRAGFLSRSLDLKYPRQVDAAVNAALRPLSQRRKAGQRAEEQQQQQEAAQAALGFVEGALQQRGARALLPGAPTMLAAAAVAAPSGALRRRVRRRVAFLRAPCLVAVLTEGGTLWSLPCLQLPGYLDAE